jgi:hypothetical protein
VVVVAKRRRQSILSCPYAALARPGASCPAASNGRGGAIFALRWGGGGLCRAAADRTTVGANDSAAKLGGDHKKPGAIPANDESAGRGRSGLTVQYPDYLLGGYDAKPNASANGILELSAGALSFPEHGWVRVSKSFLYINRISCKRKYRARRIT